MEWRSVLLRPLLRPYDESYHSTCGGSKSARCKKTATKVCRKSDSMSRPTLRERCAPCSAWKRHPRSSTLHSRRYCLLLYDMEIVNLETTEPSNTTTEHHILTKKRKTDVPNIFHHLLTRIHGRRIVPIWIPWITVFGTNLFRPSTGIKWHRNLSNFATQVRCEKSSFGCFKEKLFCLDESFVSHDTKRWKLFKRIKSSLFDRESKDESF